MTLLLYRNDVHSRGVLFPAGLTGLSEVLVAGAVGTFLAAVVTPPRGAADRQAPLDHGVPGRSAG